MSHQQPQLDAHPPASFTKPNLPNRKLVCAAPASLETLRPVPGATPRTRVLAWASETRPRPPVEALMRRGLHREPLGVRQ